MPTMLRGLLAAAVFASASSMRLSQLRTSRREAGALIAAGPLLASLASAPSVAIAAPALAPPAPAPPADAPDPIQSTVGVQRLVSNLAGAPQRTVLITGSNSGVGLAGAKLLVAAGHNVILACRTKAKADAAAAACLAFAAESASRAGGTATGIECDLASLRSVRAAAAALKGTPLDSVVLNAGVAMNTRDKQPKRTEDGFELTIGTNHLGHFLLAELLVDDVAKASAPRVVLTASPVHDPLSGGGNVGSTATLGGLDGLAAGNSFAMVDGGAYDPDKAYKDSKLCNVLFMAEAARRYATKGVSVNAFSPGLIASPEGFFRYQNPFFANVFDKISRAVGVAETNEFGGSALAYLAVDPALDGVSGAWYDTLPPGKHQLAVHLPSAEARNSAEQARLWELSAKAVGL